MGGDEERKVRMKDGEGGSFMWKRENMFVIVEEKCGL